MCPPNNGLVHRDRGRVNHVDWDPGLAYWFRMNNNGTEDLSIQKRIPMTEEKLRMLMTDPDIARQHYRCVAAHKDKISALKKTNNKLRIFYKTKNHFISDRDRFNNLTLYFSYNNEVT